MAGVLVLIWAACAWAQGEPPKPTSEETAQTEQAEVYVCPMHPEVRTDQPGRCSKCQMLLEPIRKEAGITVGAGAHADHESKSGGVLTMVGDYHIELVEKDGAFQVYLYDAFTKPMTVAGLKNGALTYQDPTKPQGTEPVTLPLMPNETNEFLMVTRPAGIEPEEVTVRLPYGNETFEMTFPLRITLEGRVVDVACFAKEGMAALARSHDECARMCLLAGSPIGILVGDDPNATVYLVTIRGEGTSSQAANERLLRFVSREVRVEGRLVQRGQLKLLELQDVRSLD